MIPAARAYGISAVVLLALDLLWLGVLAPPLYQRTIGSLLRQKPDLVAATLFYAIYLTGVNEFVIRASSPGSQVARVAARGALFGLVAYATFDLTALAMIAGLGFSARTVSFELAGRPSQPHLLGRVRVERPSRGARGRAGGGAPCELGPRLSAYKRCPLV